MKSKKLISAISMAALASVMTIPVSAADWSQASYADNDPNTGKIIESGADYVTFTNTGESTDIAKCRITLDKVIKNSDDAKNVWKMTWKVRYNNRTSDSFV